MTEHFYENNEQLKEVIFEKELYHRCLTGKRFSIQFALDEG